MTKITYIPGEIANAAIDGNGKRKPVTRTQHIFDDTKGKSQAEINEEFGNAIGGLNSQNYITVDSFNALPATGEADTVYRVSNWDGTQQDPTVYSEYAWDGEDYVHLSTKTQIGEVFDISAYHATGGTLATYTDLSAALDSNNGGGVPQSFQKGGMSVKFVRTSDNKYVQCRYMGTETTGTPNPFLDVNNWKGDEDYIEESVNLYNKNSTLNLSDSSLVGNRVITVEGYSVSCPMPVEYGKTYKYKHDSTAGRGFWYTDSIGDMILADASSDAGDGYNTFTASRNGYVRVNLGRQSPDIFMFCESSKYPSYYIPYEKYLTNDFSLNETQKEEVVKIAVANPLLGKFIALDGDSICAGAGYIGGYGKIIADENKMTYENKAAGGGTITYGTQTSGGVDKHWICTSVETLNTDADYIIIEGGVNDSVSDIGTPNNSFNLNDFDKTTFIGALDYMFYKLYERFPGKKIGFIIVHAVPYWIAAQNTAKYAAAVNACKKWGIPYLDLNIEVPPFGLLPNENYLRANYTSSGDGYHPNEAGYRKYYVPKITTWLRTL